MILPAVIACDTPADLNEGSPSQARPVWNQAYQENTEADTVSQIVSQARDAYVLLDPFSEGFGADPAAIVSELQSNGNEVSAYISIGSGEDWRDDFEDLNPYLVTRQWGDWEGEYFVSDTAGALPIMKARVDRIASWGFDWVEFDNMDWVYDDEYRAEYGFSATIPEGAAYYQALCDYVLSKGMACMAKSTVDEAGSFDGVTYESYPDDRNWWDQAGAKSFVAAGKLVVIVHYDEPNCAQVRDEYQAIYGPDLSFICEDPRVGGYVHF
ncbi:endo alpha-1,4 polygalactosaminidase [Yoonia maricola]|uniref:endo alpha-1,4 polygalactosaminidase n=1 Tax=Yoonia maricola TaxID=420999 RepID=UPI00145503E2|nr:endo alpha-1,4 polygalactosaminidase [Yoonia maricola]